MMVNIGECVECDAGVDYLSRDKGLACECGGEIEFVGKVGVVYSSGNDIRPGALELVEEWREASDNDADKGYSDAAGTWAVAAKELEELLEENGTLVAEPCDGGDA